MKGGLQMLTQATISCHQMEKILLRRFKYTRAQAHHKNSQITLLRREQPMALIRYLVREGFVLLIIQIANRFN